MPYRIKRKDVKIMSLGEKINEIRKRNSISIDELCRRSGVPKGTLSKITAGITANPTLDTVQAIAKALNCSLDDLDDSPKAHSLTPKEYAHIKKYRALDGHGKEVVDVVLDKETERMQSLAEQAEDEDDNVIDVDFSSLKASAGSGFDLYDAPTDKLRLILNNTTRQADICIKVDGHSMEPVFCDGDILLVRNQPAVDVGEYGIFIINDCGYVKKQGPDRLISVNDEYDDIYPSEYDNVRCCGKVIGVLDTDWIVE